MEKRHLKQHSSVILPGFICIILTVLIILYKSNKTLETESQDETTKNQIPDFAAKLVNPIEIKRPRYPHCVRNDSGKLFEIIYDLVEELTTCNLTEAMLLVCEKPVSPIEKGRGGMVVIYAAVTLLLVSLCAATVEVWRVRNRSTPTVSTSATKDPPQLSRRCSLADLTVLRHNRREFMLRRDSSMHMSVDGGLGTPSASIGVGLQPRVPLKLLGSSKSQDEGRRSSVSKTCKWQRSVSVDKADELTPDVHHHRIHLIRHH